VTTHDSIRHALPNCCESCQITPECSAYLSSSRQLDRLISLHALIDRVDRLRPFIACKAIILEGRRDVGGDSAGKLTRTSGDGVSRRRVSLVASMGRTPLTPKATAASSLAPSPPLGTLSRLPVWDILHLFHTSTHSIMTSIVTNDHVRKLIFAHHDTSPRLFIVTGASKPWKNFH